MSSRAFLGVCVALTCSAAEAHAYTIQSVVTVGCHESISSEALRDVRAELPALRTIEPTEDEQALIDDLQFSPDEDMLDLASVALLIGVRDNDLKGRGADELDELSQVHGNPDAQDEHCLRALDQDEPSGSQQAIAACRAYIERRIEQALDGLDANGLPDAQNRIELPIHLAIRGGIDASLPLFYVRMGQALHTLQDGFSHTYRTSDGKRVTVALNWLDLVGRTLEEETDGPGHSSDLDTCDDADELRRIRRQLATRASTEVLREALQPGTTGERMARVRVVLDRYLGVESGCTFDNGWCEAPEASYDACACRSAGGPASRSGFVGLALLGAAFAIRSRRRLGALAIAIASLPATAMAQEPPPETPKTKTEVIPSSDPEKPPITATQETDGEKTTTTVTVPTAKDEEAPPPPNIVPVAEPGPREPNALAFGGALTFSGSVDKPGFAGAIGARLRLHKHWAIGLDGEWNPWISLTGGEPVRSGAANIYASGFLRFPLVYEKFNLRSQLSLGTSVLLSDLYGAPKGSAGLFIGANFIGLEYKATDWFYLVINPLGVAIPIPQLEGVPFVYPQYRLQLGLEFYGG